jgi:glycylpeptide N-tetradecanoyltransferase
MQVKEVFSLLERNYVEDDGANFRFRYSEAFLNWALKSPGWKKEWHVGVRVTKSRSLVATIFGVPIDLRVRKSTFRSAEVNFLCIHWKLRGKNMAPVLIKEITRRFNMEGIYQAIYTAGVVLPAPVSSCRYFHRTLDTNKLIETGFSSVPRGTTAQRQALRNRLPPATAVPGVRPMEEKDIDAVSTLLEKYLARFDMSQTFSKEEMRHWALQSPGQDQVVWSYVVEKEGKITDFFSFYVLESTIIRQSMHGHRTIKAAYLYYYATDIVSENNEAKLKTRLNELIKDALILAKRVSDLAVGIFIADAQAEQVRRVQRAHAHGQPSVPRGAEVRSWRRAFALLPLQLPNIADRGRNRRHSHPERSGHCHAVEH